MQGHIAIVDDDASVRRSMARLLEAHSFQVRSYTSARAFLKSLEFGTPGCLITDLQMNEMTGLELLHHLAGTGLRIPTIVVTADTEPGLRRRCELAGAAQFLGKPMDGDALVNAVQTVTQEKDRHHNPAAN